MEIQISEKMQIFRQIDLQTHFPVKHRKIIVGNHFDEKVWSKVSLLL